MICQTSATPLMARPSTDTKASPGWIPTRAPAPSDATSAATTVAPTCRQRTPSSRSGRHVLTRAILMTASATSTSATATGRPTRTSGRRSRKEFNALACVSALETDLDTGSQPGRRFRGQDLVVKRLCIVLMDERAQREDEVQHASRERLIRQPLPQLQIEPIVGQ